MDTGRQKAPEILRRPARPSCRRQGRRGQKTTCSGATAAALAAQGHRTLLITPDMTPSLSDILEQRIGDAVTAVGNNLDACEISQEAIMAWWRKRFGRDFNDILAHLAGRKAKAMNLEISIKEYRDLLDILHIADVVMSGHRREEDKRTERQRALIQKLYALARSEGLDRLIGYNDGVNKYVTTAEFEQSSLAHAVIDEFGDHLFWDELISRLTARDAAQIAGGIARLNAMSDSDRQAVEGPIRQRYIEEFSTQGTANLAVIERFGIGGGIPVKTSD